MPAELLHEDTTVDAEALLCSHDRHLDGTCTGWIDLDIRTLTPLFVGATQSEDKATVARSLRVADKPVIPGSSLRGMLRHYLRMWTGGETGPVNTPQLFFRQPARVGPGGHKESVIRQRHAEYGERGGMTPVRPGRRVLAGFLRFRDGKWWISPLATERPLQMRMDELKDDLDERFSDLQEFPLPPKRDPKEKSKKENYIPAKFHREFQYLPVTALCVEPPDDPDDRDRNIEECKYWAIAVVPPGSALDTDIENLVRDRVEAHWFERRDKADEDASRTGGNSFKGRADAFERALDHVDNLPIYSVSAILVFTGITSERKNVYLFPTDPDPDRKPDLPVRKELIEQFESTSQITPFQEDNFPNTLGVGTTNPKRPVSRQTKHGTLPRAAQEPVWYKTDQRGNVVSFGRAGGYRVPVRGWDADPIREAVPEALIAPDPKTPQDRTSDKTKKEAAERLERWRNRRVDVPRMLFGDLDLVNGRVSAARGRVSFGTAVCEDSTSTYPHVLRVQLLKPGRTCFANYLQQPAEVVARRSSEMITWSHEDKVDLNGYKIYLHRHCDKRDRLAEEHGRKSDAGQPADSERDVQPLPSGLTFYGRITFTNLTRAELGGLMRMLLLGNPVDGGPSADPAFAHRIGMGKALGMGSVHIRPRLHLVNPAKRAVSLSLDAGVSPARDSEIHEFLDAFDTAVRDWERRQSSGPGFRPSEVWQDSPRAKAVLLAAQWKKRLDWEYTHPMELEEYAEYRPLPAITMRFDKFSERAEPES